MQREELLKCHGRILLLLFILLGASWLWQPTRLIWDAWDETVFWFMNGLLRGGDLAVTIWAISNWRPFDLVGGALIFAWVFWWWLGEKPHRLQAGFYLTGYAVFSFIWIQIGHQLLRMIDYRRESPTMVFEEGVIRINSLIEGYRVKEQSGVSFPGDHATVLLLAVLFIGMHRGWKPGLLALCTAIPLMLPRLVSGAHWLTDITVGGVLFAAFIAALWWGSPLAARWWSFCGSVLQKMLEPWCTKWLPRPLKVMFVPST